MHIVFVDYLLCAPKQNNPEKQVNNDQYRTSQKQCDDTRDEHKRIIVDFCFSSLSLSLFACIEHVLSCYITKFTVTQVVQVVQFFILLSLSLFLNYTRNEHAKETQTQNNTNVRQGLHNFFIFFFCKPFSILYYYYIFFLHLF